MAQPVAALAHLLNQGFIRQRADGNTRGSPAAVEEVLQRVYVLRADRTSHTQSLRAVDRRARFDKESRSSGDGQLRAVRFGMQALIGFGVALRAPRAAQLYTARQRKGIHGRFPRRAFHEFLRLPLWRTARRTPNLSLRDSPAAFQCILQGRQGFPLAIRGQLRLLWPGARGCQAVEPGLGQDLDQPLGARPGQLVEAGDP